MSNKVSINRRNFLKTTLAGIFSIPTVRKQINVFDTKNNECSNLEADIIIGFPKDNIAVGDYVTVKKKFVVRVNSENEAQGIALTDSSDNVVIFRPI